jgi:hypothetical protein
VEIRIFFLLKKNWPKNRKTSKIRVITNFFYEFKNKNLIFYNFCHLICGKPTNICVKTVFPL